LPSIFWREKRRKIKEKKGKKKEKKEKEKKKEERRKKKKKVNGGSLRNGKGFFLGKHSFCPHFSSLSIFFSFF